MIDKKKALVAGGIGIVVGLGIFSGFLLLKTRNKEALQKSESEQLDINTVRQKLLPWDDPAGFTFEYPEGLTIDKHDEDQENYAHVEMTNPDHPGRLIVWAKDTTSADVAAWVRTEKTFKNGNVLDTTLGGQPAKKVLVTSPAPMLVTGTIFDELLFFIESSGEDREYWSTIHETIADSFAFTPLEDESTTLGGGAEDVVVDEEEVVE